MRTNILGILYIFPFNWYWLPIPSKALESRTKYFTIFYIKQENVVYYIFLSKCFSFLALKETFGFGPYCHSYTFVRTYLQYKHKGKIRGDLLTVLPNSSIILTLFHFLLANCHGETLTCYLMIFKLYSVCLKWSFLLNPCICSIYFYSLYFILHVLGGYKMSFCPMHRNLAEF